MFQITEFIEATLASVTNRVEKHGDDDMPAVSLGIVIEAANTMLDQIDPNIRQALYKAVDDQKQLPGVEPATPVLRCNSFDTVALTTTHEGWTLHVDDSLDEQNPMQFGGCKVDKFKVDAKQGGSIELRFRVGTSDVDAERLGALGMHNGQSIWIKLLPPEKKPDAIDGSTAAFQADHPEAGDMFAAEHGGKGPEDEGSDDDGSGNPDAGPGTGSSDDQMGKDWPFPGGASDQPQADAEGGEAPAAVAAKSRRGRKADAVGEVH